MKSPLVWQGGKSRLAKRILGILPPHEQYCEAFAGAAWVFFAKEPAKFEVLNDVNSDLVAFYRVVKNHLEEFLRQFKWLLSSREWFEDFSRQQEAGGLTDIQRAARFYYLQRQGFGGRVVGRTFGAAPMYRPRVNLLRLEEDMSAAHLRICQATIEHLPWEQFIDRYDRPDTLFYLDPPYWGCETDYGRDVFSQSDFYRMAEVLSSLRGQAVVSLNDTPQVRSIFDKFNIIDVTTRYSCGRSTNIPASEVLITTWPCTLA
ncbi:MAG: DNA adenine methylase [Desulfovibrionaceae bacterium]